VKVAKVLEELKKRSTKETLEGMSRYGIPNDRAFGVSMGDMKRYSKGLGVNHALALDLWKTGWYEARTVAVFIDDAEVVSRSQMDTWARDFDSWAICDTTCFHLFDRTPHAWSKLEKWARSKREFVRRAAFAMIWSLSVHDKTAPDDQFVRALGLVERYSVDERPLVKKGIDMALRATGKRNATLNRVAVRTAKRLSKSDNRSAAWIGSHSLRELQGDKVLSRLT